MKIAIVHDELMRKGGAERVALCFHKAFPQATIYTLAYRKRLTYPDFKQCSVVTSWFQRLAVNERWMKRLFFPFGILAMKQMDLKKFDVLLISSTHCAKYIKVKNEALVINYCHCPFRLLWFPSSYKIYQSYGGGVIGWAVRKMISVLRVLDYRAAQRTNYFLSNSKVMADKIMEVYRPKYPVQIINPPVSCSKFSLSLADHDYYLVVSRLEHYKKVDLVVDSFRILNKKLIIVGRGTYQRAIAKTKAKNIVLKTEVEEHDLIDLYRCCKALIFPQKEDYGITPLEANATGKPVIAYGEGGVLETMIPYRGDAKKATALFFDEQTVESLVDAIHLFESLDFNPHFIRQHALKHDMPHFVDMVKSTVKKRYKEHFTSQ